MRARVVAAVAVLVAVSAVTYAVWVRTLPGVEGSLLVQGYGTDLPSGLAAVAWTVTGAVLLALRPRNVLGWLIVVVSLCQSLQQGLAAYGGYGVALADPQWPLARWIAWLSSGLYLPGLLPLLSLLPALYPNGQLPSRWWRWPVGAAGLGIALMMLAAMLAPQAYDDIAPGPSPLAAPTLAMLLRSIGGMLFVGGTLVIWGASIMRLVRARTPERQQLAWLFSVVVLVTVTLVAPLPQEFIAVQILIVTLLSFFIPVAVAVGVLRYHLLGIEVMLRRGLVYSVLTAVVVGLYVAVTAVAGAQFQRGPLPGVLAAALVAVGLTPLRDRLQAAVDWLVYGDRRDPMRAMTRLGDAMNDETDLLPAVLATVTDAVRAPGAAVVAPQGSVLASYGVETAGSDAEVLALRVGGRELGVLRLTPRTPGEPYTDGDRRLLAALAPQVAAIVRALELAEALEAERDRVVTATRRERDRLRHDLHDGLGPSLSGIGLGLQALHDARATGDEGVADDLLARIRDEVATAVGEVRRILDDLRPTVLDSARLPDAIRRHAASVSAGGLEVTIGGSALPALPPDIEAAAYRITQEALTNVVRHSGARHVRVVFAVSDGAFTVSIADDGHGIVDHGRGGVGLTSMRQRAEAIRGTLSVESTHDGSTVVATLPLKESS